MSTVRSTIAETLFNDAYKLNELLSFYRLATTVSDKYLNKNGERAVQFEQFLTAFAMIAAITKGDPNQYLKNLLGVTGVKKTDPDPSKPGAKMISYHLEPDIEFNAEILLITYLANEDFFSLKNALIIIVKGANEFSALIEKIYKKNKDKEECVALYAQANSKLGIAMQLLIQTELLGVNLRKACGDGEELGKIAKLMQEVGNLINTAVNAESKRAQLESKSAQDSGNTTSQLIATFSGVYPLLKKDYEDKKRKFANAQAVSKAAADGIQRLIALWKRKNSINFNLDRKDNQYDVVRRAGIQVVHDRLQVEKDIEAVFSQLDFETSAAIAHKLDPDKYLLAYASNKLSDYQAIIRDRLDNLVSLKKSMVDTSRKNQGNIYQQLMATFCGSLHAQLASKKIVLDTKLEQLHTRGNAHISPHLSRLKKTSQLTFLSLSAPPETPLVDGREVLGVLRRRASTLSKRLPVTPVATAATTATATPAPTPASKENGVKTEATASAPAAAKKGSQHVRQASSSSDYKFVGRIGIGVRHYAAGNAAGERKADAPVEVRSNANFDEILAKFEANEGAFPRRNI